MPPFSGLGIRGRITLGFAVVGTLLLATVISVQMVLSQTGDSFREFVELGEKSRQEVQLGDWVNGMRREVLNFVHLGHPSSIREVKRLRRQIETALKERQAHSQRPQAFDEALEHLENYYEAFTQVTVQRENRERLLNEKLARLSGEIESRLGSLAENDAMVNQFLLVEKNVYRYFDTLENDYFIQAKERTQVALEMAERMKNRRKGAEIAQLLRRHQATYVEAVQRTRTYLFLVNVVMAAEAYELLYQVKQMGVAVSRGMEASERQILDANDALGKTLLAAGALLVLLAWITAVYIIRSVTRPILEMAGTFDKLASGVFETQIPPYDIRDEIGTLTQAAKVFRSRNQEMARLLVESQEMARNLKARDLQLRQINQELEERVARAVRKAEQQDEIIFQQMRERSISDLLINIAHHWRQPLNVIAIAAQDVQDVLDYDGGDREQIDRDVEKILESTMKLSKVISRFSRLHRETRYAEKEHFDLAEASDLAGELLEPEAEKRNMEYRYLREEPVPFFSFKQAFVDILVTLVRNAMEVGEQRKVAGGRVELAVHRDEEAVELWVDDNMGGVDPEIRDHLFEPYQTTNFREENKGLGLFFVKRTVVNALGGEIRMEPTREGTRFIIRIPHEPTV